MRDSDTVTAMRRDLGRQLAARRKAAGYVQRELGVMVGYSRTAIANAETGNARIGRQLWQAADTVLGTGELFARGYDRIQAQIAAEAQAHAARLVAAMPPVAQAADGGLASVLPGQARQAYQERGWPVEHDAGGRLWLMTGTVLDALEVPRPAAMVAASWWLYTRGVPDPIRGLPALPDPAAALAVISAGSRCYFLARSGACPWTAHDITVTGAGGAPGPAVIRWHATGGRIPAPPTPLPDGQHATWAHPPAGDGPLVSPMALLHLLAHATTTTTGYAALILPGGVHVLPAAPAPDHPPTDGQHPAHAAGITASR